jgi:hypothetical protein
VTVQDIDGRQCTGKLVRVGNAETFRVGSCDRTVDSQGSRLSSSRLDRAQFFVYNDCLQEADRGVLDAVALYDGRPGACELGRHTSK